MLLRILAGVVACLSVGALAGWTPAAAAENDAEIVYSETSEGTLQVLFALPEGVGPELGSVDVTINGATVAAKAEPVQNADATERVQRTAVLAIDTSISMNGKRFVAAKSAAQAFLDAAPHDVRVGIVSFDSDVEVLQAPTEDRDAASAVIDALELSRQTLLHDGVLAAVKAAGTSDQRSVLVLSDGRDTSTTELKDVVSAIGKSGVRVDVVALEQETNLALEAMASEGGGSVLPASDASALEGVFSDQAAALSRQVLVTADLADDLQASEGSVTVSISAAGETYTDSAFVSLGNASSSPRTTDDQTAIPSPPPTPRFAVSKPLMWGGLGALGLSGVLLLGVAMGGLGRRDREGLESHISAYTRAGAARQARASAGRHAGQPSSTSVAHTAVGAAQRALDANKGFEANLGSRLDGAGLALRPAEWLLLHAGIAVGLGLIVFLISGGGLLLTLLAVGFGALCPWFYLGLRKSRRLKAFNGQLPETLQLLAGSISAGLSLAQAMDSVVREGSDPVASEFRRAIVETRLGVQVEDALEAVAGRMESDDFAWVVMAIRIQRDVGGNLSELLLKVSGTMREREYLRRQVKTLSAEGRLSGWILGALPPGMLAYMVAVNPEYLSPLISTPLGWLMLGGAALLMVVGAFWMSRVVKVEV